MTVIFQQFPIEVAKSESWQEVSSKIIQLFRENCRRCLEPLVLSQSNLFHWIQLEILIILLFLHHFLAFMVQKIWFSTISSSYSWSLLSSGCIFLKFYIYILFYSRQWRNMIAEKGAAKHISLGLKSLFCRCSVESPFSEIRSPKDVV